MITAGQTGFQFSSVREMIIVVAQINRECETDLFEIGKADRLLTFLFGAGERRQQ